MILGASPSTLWSHSAYVMNDQSRVLHFKRRSQVTGIAGYLHVGIEHVGGSHVHPHLGHEGAIGSATHGVVERYANIPHDGDVFTPRASLAKDLDHFATKEFMTPRQVEFPRDELLCGHFNRSL